MALETLLYGMEIINAPWSSLKKQPQVKLLDDSEAKYHFELTIYSLDTAFFEKIKDYLAKMAPSVEFCHKANSKNVF